MISLVVVALALTATPGDAAERLHRCIEKQDRACLATELKAFVKDSPPEYLSAAAEAYLMLGRNAEAAGAITAAVAKKPGDYDLLLQQGRTLQRAGDQVHAIEAFLHAAKAQQPPPAEVFYSLGLSFFLLHEYERAGKHFQHSVELDPKSDKSEFMLAVIDIMKENNEASARAHMLRALELQPENPHYLLHYGVLLAQMNDREKAMEVLEEAVRADGSNPLSHFNLGRVARQVNDLTKARTELEEAVRLRPELARAHYQLASVYRALGEKDKAAESMRQFQKYKDQDQDDEPVDGPPAYAFREPPAK